MNRLGLIFFLCLCAQVSAQEPATDFTSTYKAYNRAYQAGEFKSALKHAKLAVELGKIKYGEKSENYTNLLYNMALMQAKNSKRREASNTMQQVVQLKQNLRGENSIEHLTALLEFIQLNSKIADRKIVISPNKQ